MKKRILYTLLMLLTALPFVSFKTKTYSGSTYYVFAVRTRDYSDNKTLEAAVTNVFEITAADEPERNIALGRLQKKLNNYLDSEFGWYQTKQPVTFWYTSKDEAETKRADELRKVREKDFSIKNIALFSFSYSAGDWKN